MLRPDGQDRGDDVVHGPDVLAPERDRDAGLGEQPPALALERDRPELGARPVDRHVEGEGEGHLMLGHVPRFDEGRPAADGRAQLRDQVRPADEASRHGTRRPVVPFHDPDPALDPCPAVGWQEGRVVVDGGLLGTAGRDVHELARRDASRDKDRTEVAVLERRDPVAVMREQRFADAVGRKGDEDVVDVRTRPVRREPGPRRRSSARYASASVTSRSVTRRQGRRRADFSRGRASGPCC